MLLKNDGTLASEALPQPIEARASVLSMLSDSNHVAGGRRTTALQC